MEFTNRTSVFTFDGHLAGSLQRVVIDPETKEITHIVVQKGRLFKDDKVINAGHIASASAERVDLHCTSDDIKEMSPLNIKQYVPMGLNTGQGEKFGEDWNHAAVNNLVAVNSRTIREDLVALKEGARVTSQDGDSVGTIERVLTAPETSRVSQLVISHGLLAKTRKSIPIDWVKLMDDDQIWLSVRTRQLDDLPLAEE